MSRRILRSMRSTLVVGLPLLAGCGGGGDPTGDGGNGATFFTAIIGGQAWSSNPAPYVTLTAGSVPGQLVISGQQVEGTASYRTILLSLGRIEGPGIYPLGVDGSTVAGGSGTVLIAAGGAPTTWLTPLTGSAGTLIITSLTSSRIVGNFSFTAGPLQGQSGSSQAVTGGQFNLPLPTGFVPASGSSRGSTMTATIGGNAWSAASVTAQGSLQTGSFILGGINATTYQLFITPFPALSVGSFPLSAGTTVRVNQVGGTNAWGAAGSTGSVTITSLGGGRVAGTFTTTLTPIGATIGSLAASGAFDINLGMTN